MALYRKERDGSIYALAGEGASAVSVVPRMYGVLLAGVLLLMSTVFAWSVFGTIDRTVTVTGLYHPDASPAGEVVAFVPIVTGKTLSPGMEATASLAGYDTQRTGQMRGEVTFVEEGVTSVDEMRSILGDDTLVNVFVQEGPVVLVAVRLERDGASSNGYAWTQRAGRDLVVHDLTYANLTVIKETVHPITLGIKGLAEFFGE